MHDSLLSPTSEDQENGGMANSTQKGRLFRDQNIKSTTVNMNSDQIIPVKQLPQGMPKSMTFDIEKAVRPSSQSDDGGADDGQELPEPSKKRKSTAKFKSGEEKLKKCSTVEI